MKTRIILALAIAAGMTATTLAETHVIEAYTTSFVPSEVDAAPGDTIRWVYVTGYPHSVTSGDNCTYDGLYFNEYPLSTFEWVVPDDAPAEVPFFCDPHCNNGMEGMINVVAPEVPGRLEVGIVDLADIYVDFGVDPDTGMGGIYIESYDGHFSLGFEIEDGDLEIDFSVAGNVYMSDGTTTELIPNGKMLLEEGSRFAVHGENDVIFTMTWQDEVGTEGPDFIGLECHECSLNANGDNMSVRSAGQFAGRRGSSAGAVLYFRGEGEIPMSVIGDVTSATLTLPGFAEDGLVYIPAGVHTIELNASSADDDLAWVLLEMGDGDDGGGGCPEDVNDDGIVNVNDLLAIIGAWGNTCP